jgi:enamine deaminase RidA (YjgF/YER057c/UK114 family)
MKKIIITSKAPSAIGPYSQAVVANGTLYISGQIPINPETGKIVEGGIAKQTLQARAAFAVKELPLGALIEIETIAVK